MSNDQLSFRKSANIDRVTDKRKDSLFRLVDTDGSGTIDAQEFAVLYDAIKKDLAEELEKEAQLQQEATSAKRRFKMLMLFVGVLVSFLAASVAANFAVIFTVVDQAITTTTTSDGLLEVKGSDMIAKTAIATQEVPLVVAPVLDIDTLAEVTSLKVTYTSGADSVKAKLAIVGVRKHNATFVEFVTDVSGETVEILNGIASLVKYPNSGNRFTKPTKYGICSANATCSAFSLKGIEVEAALDLAKAELEKIGLHNEARRLQYIDSTCVGTGTWTYAYCGFGTSCGSNTVADNVVLYHNGYTGVRHVVFFLHGFTQISTDAWDAFCVAGTWDCPDFTIPAFEHLSLNFPTSSITGTWGTHSGNAWALDITQTEQYSQGGALLSQLACGQSAFTTPTACGTTGWLSNYGVGSGSEVMIVGYSNGGGLAVFLNFGAGAMVSKAVAIDYHGYVQYTAWMPNWESTSSTTGLSNKLYYSCASYFFSTDAIFPESDQNGFQILGDLSSDGSPVSKSYEGRSFVEWSWSSSDGKSVAFSVHGLNIADPTDWSDCTNSVCDGSDCTGMGVHIGMLEAVQDAVKADVLDWVTLPSPPPPSPPVIVNSPPPPSPSPPPPLPPNTAYTAGVQQKASYDAYYSSVRKVRYTSEMKLFASNSAKKKGFGKMWR